jgi:hypothetical protein
MKSEKKNEKRGGKTYCNDFFLLLILIIYFCTEPNTSRVIITDFSLRLLLGCEELLARVHTESSIFPSSFSPTLLSTTAAALAIDICAFHQLLS